MSTYKEIAEANNNIYTKATTVENLTKSVDSLTKLSKEISSMGQSASDLGQNVDSLLLRVKAKMLFVKYLGGGYYADDQKELADYLDEQIPVAEQKGWNNTAELCKRLREFTGLVDNIMCDAIAIIGSVRASDDSCLTGSVDMLEKVKKQFEDKLALTEALPAAATLFGARVVLPDVVANIKADISEMCDWCDKSIADIAEKSSKKFFEENVRPLEFDKSDISATYSPSVMPDSFTTAKVIVLNTPFPDEALLGIGAHAAETKSAFGVLNGAELGRLSSGDIKRLFDIFVDKKMGCVIENIGSYHSDDDGETLYSSFLDLGKCGMEVFIIDDRGDMRVYNNIFSFVQGKDGFSAMDATNVYVRMPQYNEFLLALSGALLIPSGVDDANVKDNMMFAGYVGLNNILSVALSGGSWRNVGKEFSDRRYNAGLEYLKHLPSQIQLLDLGWGEFEINAAADRNDHRDFGNFDYDEVAGINPKNIKSIVESTQLNIFEKCGGVTLYCTLCGMDKSVWKDLPLEEKNVRISAATKYVARTLSTAYVPEVKIITNEDMEKRAPGAGGLCCDGGKQILYREGSVENIDWLIRAICHECFHSFQHTAIMTGWKRWHWEELGVTEGRIDRWNNNFSMYVGDVNSVTYKVEIVESDAVAFEKDCAGVSVKALVTVGLQ